VVPAARIASLTPSGGGPAMTGHGYPRRAPRSRHGPDRGPARRRARAGAAGSAGSPDGYERVTPGPSAAAGTQDHLPDVGSDRVLTRGPAAGPTISPARRGRPPVPGWARGTPVPVPGSKPGVAPRAPLARRRAGHRIR